MKVFIIMMLNIFTILAMAEQKCGDTIGSSLSMLSSIQSNGQYIADPEQTIGKEAAKSPERLIKHLCGMLGSQIGYSFSINSSLRLHTVDIEKNQAIPKKINEIIDVLNDARNTYCSGPVSGTKAIKAIQEASGLASKKAEELAQLLRPRHNTSSSQESGSKRATR